MNDEWRSDGIEDPEPDQDEQAPVNLFRDEDGGEDNSLLEYDPLFGELPASEPGTRQEYVKYKAFISYSHFDKKWGDWLHKALETYRIPKGLIGRETIYGKVPARLYPVFRDREELPTSTELSKVINTALRQSSHLVVICSPHSAKSQWVGEEILQFKRLGKGDRILCLIVDGEPNAADKPELGQEECFPESIKFEMGDISQSDPFAQQLIDGELTEKRTEPIAADARKGKDEKHNSLMKIVAGLLGVGFDDLKQREARRRQKRMMAAVGLCVVLIVGMVSLTGWALLQRSAAIQQTVELKKQRTELEEQRSEAEKQRSEAEKQRSKVEGAITALQEAKKEEDNQRSIAMEKTAEAERNLDIAERNAYILDMRLLQNNWENSSFVGFQELLDRYAVRDDLKGFEWAYWNRLFNETCTLDDSVVSVSFSPNGKRIASGNNDGTVKIWDTETGQVTLTINATRKTNGRPRIVASVAFSPEGNRIVSLDEYGVLKVWDVDTGRQLLTL